MNDHEKLDYVEFPARDLGATKPFFFLNPRETNLRCV